MTHGQDRREGAPRLFLRAGVDFNLSCLGEFYRVVEKGADDLPDSSAVTGEGKGDLRRRVDDRGAFAVCPV